MRKHRTFVLGASLLVMALIAAACSSGGGGSNNATTSGGQKGLTLGAPSDCTKEPFCIPGMKKVYGITFADFKPLDFGTPTVTAIDSGAIQVGELFSLDPTIADKGYTVLTDDKDLQAAGNFVPIVRKEVASAQLGKLLDSVTTKLTDENMRDMVGQVQNEHKDVSDVAQKFLDSSGLLSGSSGSASGDLTVGVSGAFAENQLVAEMYAQVLENAGYSVSRELDLKTRDVSDPALTSGKIDLKPEYTGFELGFWDPKAATNGSPAEVASALQSAAAKKGLVTYKYSPANSTNVFVVLPSTASTYHLTDMSSLAPVASAAPSS